jgi:hypothetical protein
LPPLDTVFRQSGYSAANPPAAAELVRKRQESLLAAIGRAPHGQLHSVHASGHVDVREHQGNVRAKFQEGNRFVRVASLKRHKAGFLDDLNGKHSQERPTPHMLPVQPKSSETRAIILLISLDSEHLQVWPDDGFAVDLELLSVEQEVGGSSPPNCTI